MISFLGFLKKLLIIILLFVLPPFSALSPIKKAVLLLNPQIRCGYCHGLDFELTSQLLILKT